MTLSSDHTKRTDALSTVVQCLFILKEIKLSNGKYYFVTSIRDISCTFLGLTYRPT